MKRIELFILAACTLSATSQSPATTRYVNLNNPAPVSPYTSWGAAATNIQDAVDVSTDGDLIVVTNGVYQTGSRLTSDSTQNRLVITNSVTVQSVNGQSVTTINGLNATRCVYLSGRAVLAGFTLTGGQATDGGGLFCASSDQLVLNCQLRLNFASHHGGGAIGGTLNNCLMSSNSTSAGQTSGGGAYVSTLNNCTLSGNSAAYGGGAYYCTANNCILSNNWATGYDYCYGGGAMYGTLNNCMLLGNTANAPAYILNWGLGGGSAYSTLNNCTVYNNLAVGTYGVGGGTHGATLNNCIVYYNSAASNPNYNSSTLNYCCTTPLPSGGLGNITYEPQFVGALRLQASSPCINSGYNAYAPGPTDLDGNPRVSGGTSDMGAYEFQNPSSVISYAWLQSYGLPTDGSADYADPDRDGMNNWREWVAGTNPTNAASVLKILSVNSSATNKVITWSSVSTRAYSLAMATNPVAIPAFSVVWSNIAGLAGTTSFTDTNPSAGPAAFYRVAVQPP